MPDINLSPYTAESEAIARKIRMAEALQQQASSPMEMPTLAGARASPYSGLAKMLQAYSAQKMRGEAEKQQRALATTSQQNTSEDFANLLKGLTPTAAVPEGAPTYMPNVDQRDVVENPRMVMQPERNEVGEIIQPGEAGAGNFGVTPGTPAIPATTGQLSAEGFKAMKTPAGQQQYMAQLLAQIAPKEGMVLPEGSSYITKSGKVLIQGAGKEDFHVPKNEFDPISGQTLTVAYSNKGNRKVIDTKGAYTPDQWNSIPVAERARMVFDQYKFGNVSATDLMQAAQKNVQLGQELAKLGFDIGPSAAGGGVRLPVNAPMPVIPGTPPAANAPAIPAAMPAALAGAQPVVARPAPAMPVAARPAAAAPAPSAVSGLTPKAQQALMLEDAQAKAKKERGMSGIGSVIDEARKIMSGEAVDKDGKPIKAPLPTQSYAGAAGDFISGVFGGSSEGAAQAEQLKVLGGALVMSMPRMEGPQSDRDVQAYREMAGQVGDNTLPIARRLKALDMVEKLYRKYDTSDVPPPNAVRRIR